MRIAGRMVGALLEVDHKLVNVAPAPALAGLDGTHDRVFGGVEMLGGVLVFGGVAAGDVPAEQALAEMHP